MPNWCENKLTVEGKKDSLVRFMEQARGKEEEQAFSLESLYPCPDSKDWYDWRITNWGTKWDVQFSGVVESNTKKNPAKVIYCFDTAWSPPTSGIQEISNQFPMLTFTLNYWEAGMGFKGKYKCKAGEVLLAKEDSYYAYAEDSDEPA